MLKLQGCLHCVFTEGIYSGEEKEHFHVLAMRTGTATMCAKTIEHLLCSTAAVGFISGQAFGKDGGGLLKLIYGDLAVFPEGNQLIKTCL